MIFYISAHITYIFIARLKFLAPKSQNEAPEKNSQRGPSIPKSRLKWTNNHREHQICIQSSWIFGFSEPLQMAVTLLILVVESKVRVFLKALDPIRSFLCLFGSTYFFAPPPGGAKFDTISENLKFRIRSTPVVICL